MTMPTVVFGNAPMGYKFVTTGNTPANALNWYHNAMSVAGNLHRNPGTYIVTVNRGMFSLFLKGTHKGKLGEKVVVVG